MGTFLKERMRRHAPWAMYRLRWWRKLLALPWRKRVLLAEAVFWLCAARAMLAFVHFSWIARYLGTLRPPQAAEPDADCDANGQRIAQEISWAVERSALLIPFKVVCLPRALAGWQMLRWRRLSGRLHFGAARGAADKELLPHAWLDACGVAVTGYPVAHDCVEIGYFSR